MNNDAVFHAIESMGESAQDVASAIGTAPDGSPVFLPAKIAALKRYVGQSEFAALDEASGRVVGGSAPSLVPALRGLPAAQLSSAQASQLPGALDMLVVQKVENGGRTYRVALHQDMTGRHIAIIGLMHEFDEELLPCFLPAFVLAVGVTWLTIRQHIRPLRRASAEASTVSADRPGQRVGTQGLAAEIRPLIDAVNRALGQLEDALLLQRRFTANAAHELRTPLAVLRARVDGMPPSPERAALTHDIGRMTRAVSQMLLTARLQARGHGETALVDLAALARFVVADMVPLAHSQGRDLALEVSGRPVMEGSEAGLESALRNLVENALRFTPRGQVVSVRVGPPARIVVEDRGPGVADADKSRILDPFWRAGDQTGEGAGLGLAIVSEVAAQHGGSISVQDAPGGGARFVLALRGTMHAAVDTQARAAIAAE
jgi:signal transduction histidine kinase